MKTLSSVKFGWIDRVGHGWCVRQLGPVIVDYNTDPARTGLISSTCLSANTALHQQLTGQHLHKSQLELWYTRRVVIIWLIILYVFILLCCVVWIIGITTSTDVMYVL